MRSVIFRYEDVAALSAALSGAHGGQGELPLPPGETVSDGEWVLAIFEIGSRRRATAAAARGVQVANESAVRGLAFERRDWDRLVGFVAARSEHMRAARPVAPTSSTKIPVAAPVSEPAIEEAPASRRGSEAPPRSRRFEDLPPSSVLESTRVPFGARVLVVDSAGETGDELRTMLAEMGLLVELVATTSDAEERMNAQSFDAIVLDLHAPGCDTRSFVGALRNDPQHGDIPVLFLSSKPTSRDVVDAFASGGDDFLPKPFRTTELAARIFGLLRRARIVRSAPGASDRTGGR